ncbi:hypothetical protein ABZP36_032177 [Zizania latifolia]
MSKVLLLLNCLTEPVLVHRQTAIHNLSSSVPHPVIEEICFSGHDEIDEWIVCAGLTAQAGLIHCHGHIDTLARRICQIEIPFGIQFSFVDNFLHVNVLMNWEKKTRQTLCYTILACISVESQMFLRL